MRFIYLFFLIPITLAAQKKAPKCEDVDALAINYFDEVPESYSGMIKVCYQTGELSALLTLKDGLSDGVAKQWHKNGNIRLVESFKEGVRHGSYKTWYKSGAKEMQSSIIKGEANGLFKMCMKMEN